MAKKILVVDDTRFFRTALTNLLKEQGWEVMEAEDGKQGVLQAVRSASSLDLILLDLQMPEMDGFEVLRSLKNDGKASKIPVLTMTADKPDLAQIDVLRSLGARGFIDKMQPLTLVVERARMIMEGEGAAGSAGD